MTATMIDAHDEILALLASALPGDLPVKWPDIATTSGFPPASGPWCRVNISDNGEHSPPTLVASPGARRYKTMGLLTVELYTMAGDGRRVAQELAQTVLLAYRGKATPSGVQFRLERADDIGPDGPWYRINCTVEYTYTTIQ